MAKVLSMEIGYSLIKIIETDFKAKNPKIYRCANLHTPEGVLNDGELNVTDELVTLIKDALTANKMKTKQVVFSVTSSKIASREVLLPGSIKESKVSTVVRANASDYFPVDISRYEIAYTTLGMVGEEKGTMQRKLMVFATPQSLLEGYQTLAEKCDLKLTAVDYSGNSILQVIKKECGQGIQMVIKIDERSSIVTVLEEGQLVLQRSIPYGVDEAVETFAEAYAYGALGYEETLDVLRKKTCVNRTMHAKIDIAGDSDDKDDRSDDGERLIQARQKTTEALEALISGITRVVDFYNSRNYGKQIGRTYLTGLGGGVKGLSELLTNELGMQIDVLKKAEGFNIAKAFRETGLGGYIACLGAAVAPLGFMSAGEKEKKEKKAFTLTPLMAVSVLILCLVISVAWFMLAYLPYMEALSDNEDYRAQVRSLAQEYVPDYLEYTTTKQAYEYMFAALGQTQLETRYLVEFIEEMERKMPHAFYISTLHVNAKGFTMNVTVGTKEEAAECIEQLRTFASIAELNVNGIYDSRQLMIVDVDGDGVLEMVSGGEIVGSAGVLFGDTDVDILGRGVTFSVEGTFSGMSFMNALSDEGNPESDGTGSEDGGSAADQTADNGSTGDDEELESAIDEINGGE